MDIINIKGRVAFLMLIIQLNIYFVPDSFSQTYSYPEVGQASPNFVFYDVHHAKSSSLSLSDFKGKYLILDFWAIGCTSCIESFPKMDALQRKFGDKVKILLVGEKIKAADVKKYYERYRSYYGLNLSVAFDSVYFKSFVHRTVPHIIWIDPNGIVQAVTTNTDVSEQTIEKFISAQKFNFSDASFKAQSKQDVKGFDSIQHAKMQSSNKESQTSIYKSIISEWRAEDGFPAYSYFDPKFSIESNNGVYRITGTPLIILFKLAYFGSAFGNLYKPDWWLWPILRTKDSLTLNQESDGRKLYNYSIRVPIDRANNLELMAMMQRDLRNAFNYNVNLEERLMPSLELVVTDQNKVRSIESNFGVMGNSLDIGNKSHFFRNYPIEEIPRRLSGRLPGARFVAYNMTGISGNVSFQFDADLLNLDSIRKGLRKIGLDLRPGFRAVKVMILSDPQ